MTKLASSIVVVASALATMSAQAAFKEEFIEASKAWGAAIADFNRDGHDDFIISGHDTDDKVWYWTAEGYKPGPYTFEWVDRHDCDAADVNRDGKIDMYCSVGADKGEGEGPKEIWLQGKKDVFSKMPNHGAEDPFGRGRLVQFFDMNNDKYPDIYLSVEATTRPDGQPNINRVFLNKNGTGFEEITTIATGNRGFQCLSKGKLNHDSYDDIIVCDLGKPSHIYLNNKANDFTEMANAAPLAENLRDAKIVDMNGDHHDDLVVLTGGNKFQVWLNNGTKTIFDAAPSFENQITYTSKSLTVGDYNHDGRMDVYVVLMDNNCRATATDAAPDIVYMGQADGTFVKNKTTQTFTGCGHLAETLDGDKVLIMNGGIEWNGPNYVLKWE